MYMTSDYAFTHSHCPHVSSLSAYSSPSTHKRPLPKLQPTLQHLKGKRPTFLPFHPPQLPPPFRPEEPTKWSHPPFSAHHSLSNSKIFTHGAQDDNIHHWISLNFKKTTHFFQFPLARLEDYARGVVELKAKEEAARVLVRMKDRLATLFSQDSDSMPRVWTGKEDIRAITKMARSAV